MNNVSNLSTSYIIAMLHDSLSTMSAEERLDVFEKIQEGYCRYCGYETITSKCYCWNDE